MSVPGSAGCVTMDGKKVQIVKNLTPKQIEHVKNKLKNMQDNNQNKTQSQKNQGNHIQYDNKINLENEIEGEKFLIIHRADDKKTMRDFSPILLEKVIANATSNAKVESKFLKSGDILIKTQNAKQAQQLIKIIGIMDAKVTVTEHKTLNSTKGVIQAYELQHEERETLLEYLKDQKVTDIYLHTKTFDGKTVKTGLAFVTFGVRELPEFLNVGLLRIRVRPYIPKPMRCYACHKYGHLSKHCNIKDTPKCYNCNDNKHIHTREDRCKNESYCINCKETGHNSYNRNCQEYKRQIEILTIKVKENISMAEAVKRYNTKRATYAQVTATNTQSPNPSNTSEKPKSNTQDTCKCQHCTFHNTPTTTSSNKRVRAQKTDSHSTDEEEMKKTKVHKKIDENLEDWPDEAMNT